jgi:predicted RNA-binding protein YlqC (UPF0109 family)
METSEPSLLMAPAEAAQLPPPLPLEPSMMSYPATFDPSAYTIYSFLVDASQIGRIIGRGGCTVRELEHTSGARIFVSSSDEQLYDPSASFPRLVTIEGPPGCIAAAISLLNLLLCTPPALGSAVAADFCSQEVLVAREHIGRVIGTKGDTIRGLQSLNGVRIQIEQSVDPCKVIVTGPTPEACASCVACIHEIVSGHASKGKYSYAHFQQHTAQAAHAAACWAGVPPAFEPHMYGPPGPA